MILDTTTKSLEVYLLTGIYTGQPIYTASYVDHTTTTVTPGSSDGLLNGVTPVTMVSAPSSSTQRQVKFISVYNNDTVANDVIIRLNNNSTLRQIVRMTLLPGESLDYNENKGFYSIGPNGCSKVLIQQQYSRSLLTYAHTSGSNNLEANYIAGMIGSPTLTNVALSANTLIAIPFVAPGRGVILERMGLQCGTLGASQECKIGIYTNTNERNIYPSKLLFDSGQILLTTTGAKTANPNLQLVGGQLYWAVILTFNGNGQLRAVPTGSQAPIYGIPSALSATTIQVGLTSSYTYGVLPTNYPTGASAISSAYPCIFLRFT